MLVFYTKTPCKTQHSITKISERQYLTPVLSKPFYNQRGAGFLREHYLNNLSKEEIGELIRVVKEDGIAAREVNLGSILKAINLLGRNRAITLENVLTAKRLMKKYNKSQINEILAKKENKNTPLVVA